MSANMTDSEIRECYRLHWMPGWREPSKEWEEKEENFSIEISGSQLNAYKWQGWWVCRANHPGSHWSVMIGIGRGHDKVEQFNDSKVARLIGEAAMIARAEGCSLGKRSFELFAKIPDEKIDPVLAEKCAEERIEAGVARRRAIEEQLNPIDKRRYIR